VEFWRDLHEVAALTATAERFEPQMGAEQRAELVAGWRAALARVLG